MLLDFRSSPAVADLQADLSPELQSPTEGIEEVMRADQSSLAFLEISVLASRRRKTWRPRPHHLRWRLGIFQGWVVTSTLTSLNLQIEELLFVPDDLPELKDDARATCRQAGRHVVLQGSWQPDEGDPPAEKINPEDEARHA